MTASTDSHVRFDPYDVEHRRRPVPGLPRLREEAPLYYNEQSRLLSRSAGSPTSSEALVDHADVHLRPGRHHRADPGEHRDALGRPSSSKTRRSTTMHRRLMSRVFSPNAVAALEPQIREFCARSPRPAGRCRRVRLHRRPRCPDADARSSACCSASPNRTRRPSAINVDANLRTEAGQPMEVTENFVRRRACSPSTSTGGPTIPRTTS